MDVQQQQIRASHGHQRECLHRVVGGLDVLIASFFQVALHHVDVQGLIIDDQNLGLMDVREFARFRARRSRVLVQGFGAIHRLLQKLHYNLTHC